MAQVDYLVDPSEPPLSAQALEVLRNEKFAKTYQSP